MLQSISVENENINFDKISIPAKQSGRTKQPTLITPTTTTKLATANTSQAIYSTQADAPTQLTPTTPSTTRKSTREKTPMKKINLLL